jgi:predicted metal-dependent phosphoesterase TrpH
MARIDLHSHSIGSKDGGLTRADVSKIFDSGQVDTLAITDHDHIDTALAWQHDFGDSLIVGEEITSQDGEIIGLYLTSLVEPGQTAAETCQGIHDQGGLVYIPHPLEKRRKGVSRATLELLAHRIDIIEQLNGRGSNMHRRYIRKFAQDHMIKLAASSDAHGPHGVGRTYTSLARQPTKETLIDLLSEAQLSYKPTSLHGWLEPSLNRWRKRA